MPNHVQNTITITGCSEERLDEILKAICYDENGDDEVSGVGTIDFSKIIPMPPSLDIAASSDTQNCINLYLTARNPSSTYDCSFFGKFDKDEFDTLVQKVSKARGFGQFNPRLTCFEVDEYLKTHNEMESVVRGRDAVDNYLEYGAMTWYDWCIRNWGTKWNSYNGESRSDGILNFQTAWSEPRPIISAIAKMYPDVEISHEWADEDIGHNCGWAEYENGELVRYCDDTYMSEKEATEFAVRAWGHEPQDFDLVMNRAQTRYIRAEGQEYELIRLFDRPALFSDERLTDEDVPQDLFLYHIRGRDDDSGAFGALEPKVVVNHAGSIVTKEPIDFGDDGFIAFDDVNSPAFLGDHITFAAFMRCDFDMDECEGGTTETPMSPSMNLN